MRLFLKIFLWFWATAMATGVALVVTFTLQIGNMPARWHAAFAQTARFAGVTAVEALKSGGTPAALSYLRSLSSEAGVRGCLFDSKGAVLVGERCAAFGDIAAQLARSGQNEASIIRDGMMQLAIRRDRGTYIFVTEVPVGPRAVPGLTPAVVARQWGVAFAVSGFICFMLARYLIAPVLELRRLSLQLAAGNLKTRASASLARRRDEIGALVSDFNTMAGRIEQLISQQRQLIFDISHEFRSPLARLNVALDLQRERKGTDSSLDHMEQDLARLNEMIEQLLTIAKLDVAVEPVPMEEIDLSEIVERIVDDAGFESQKRGIIVKITGPPPPAMLGNAALLHSAIENVVRNAIHYTPEKSSVEIAFDVTRVAEAPWVHITVSDEGPGVPDSDLKNIFRPFYRVAHSRDRQSGGTGLGLAIADRTIALHGGNFHAENAVPSGLNVRISLPLRAKQYSRL